MYPQVEQRPDGALQNILLVDDEPSVLLALKLLMQAVGYNVKDFSKASDALAYLKQNPACELMVCDLRMPNMNGLALLAESKKIMPALPVVLMSAQMTDEEVARARSLGVSSFLDKPFLPENLHQVVAAVGKKA